MEDHGRMEARVLQVLDHLQASVVTLSSARRDGYVFLSGSVDTDEKQALRLESLLRRVHGMLDVSVLTETRSAAPLTNAECKSD